MTSSVGFGLVTVAKNKGSVQKRIIPDSKGRPIKDPKHFLGVCGGITEDIRVHSLSEFAERLKNLKYNQAITLGITGLGKRQLVRQEDWVEGSKAVTRSLDFFNWSPIFPLLLDHDPEPGKTELTAEQLWQALCELIPELASVGRVVTVSTSSSIFNRKTGECLKPPSGHHSYAFARGKIERFVRIFKDLCWLKGHAYFKLGSINQQTGVPGRLERFIVDTTVFSPERLVFEAGACFPQNSPFEQRRPAPQVYEGQILDLDAIPDLSPEEKRQANYKRQQALEDITKEQQNIVLKSISARHPKLSNTELTQLAHQQIKATEKGELSPDHLLYLADGSTLRAGDITKQHDDVLLKDPQEPDYQGGAVKAKIYWNNGQWIIFSYAHGGRAYKLKSDRQQKTSFQNQLLTLDQVKQKIEHLVYEARSNAEVQISIANLAKASGTSTSIIKAIYQAVVDELELVDSIAESSKDFGELAAAAEATFNISKLLPTLAPAFNQIAAAFNQDAVAFLIPLLTVAASLLSPDTELVIGGITDYRIRPVFWGGTVSDPGGTKTPISAIPVKPLILLQVTAKDQYDQAYSDYQQAVKEYKNLKGDQAVETPEPTEPQINHYFVNSTTTEAVLRIATSQTNKGLAVIVDELSGFFNGFNQYKGGQGSDRDFWKSAADGGEIKIDRAGQQTRFAAKTALSVTGTIQPDILGRLMRGGDPDGFWSRFLWVRLPLRRLPPPDDGPKIDLTNWLYSIYQRLESLPAQSFSLSQEAKATWRWWHEFCEDKRLATDTPVERVLYPKYRDRAGRVALIAHCLEYVSRGEEPPKEISNRTLEAAIKFITYCLGQTRLLYSEIGVTSELTGDLLRIYEKVQGLGRPATLAEISKTNPFKAIKGKDGKRKRNPKNRKDYLLPLLQSLVEQGYLVKADNQYSLSVTPNEPKFDQQVEQKLSNCSTGSKPIWEVEASFVDPRIEQSEQNARVERSNGKGKPHPSEDDFEPLTNEEYQALIGGGSNGDC
jgi:hypothetical protein